MRSHDRPSRRRVLQYGGALGLGGLLTALAGCTRRTPSTSPSSSTIATASPTAGGTTQVPAPAPTPSRSESLATLSGRLTRPLLLPGSTGYPAAARLYNPRFDSLAHPAAIARCITPADVAACVQFAGASATPLALRSGGHSYGGWSTGRGLVADVSAMRSVAVDTAAATARIGAGAPLAAVYASLGAAGVAVAGGSCPTVGITGLTLGGGIGVLTRAYGLTCDALRSVELVTADGRVREVTPTRDADLFWALCGGGGGSFAAVTALTLAVRPAPAVQTFYLQWDFSHAEAVLSAWQEWIARTDRRLWSTCKLLADPGKGTLRVTVSGTWIGPAGQLATQLAPLLSSIAGPAGLDQRNSLDYPSAMLLEAGCYSQTAAGCLSDALSPAKRQPFAATSAILGQPLPSAGIAAAVSMVQAALNHTGMVEGGVSFDALGGAVASVAPAATAFVHRRALATVQYTATWPSSATGTGPVAPAAAFDAFVRGERATLSRWTGPSAYVNYADPAIADFGAAYWGTNYPRLQAVKKQYDPGNLFRFAQSVTA
jgi:FAD/FMN-containing dehydrogenase